MAKWTNIGPYVANRLAYFEGGYGTGERKPFDFSGIHMGKVRVDGLEFIINSVGKSFRVSVKPLNEKKWTKFKEHLERLEDENFWNSDNKLKDYKRMINETSHFAFMVTKNLKENPRTFQIKGEFSSYNEKNAYEFVLNGIVKPLILYENFLI